MSNRHVQPRIGALILVPALVALSFSPVIRADTLNAQSVADNTLYGEDGNQSNGAGNSFFAGRTDNSELRRALVRFDLSSIPVGSTISNVTLTLYLSRTRAQAENVMLRRVSSSWGEGTSHAPGEEGSGTAATPNDATWTYRFFNSTSWTIPGGEFSGTISATTSVGNQNGFYTWSSAGMISDVTSWVNAPASNFGWILIGNETVDKTVKRFESRQSTNASQRPVLTVTYTPPTQPIGACCLTSGSCQEVTQTTCTGLGGQYQGDLTTCLPNPCPQPTGACCFANGTCQVLTQTDCTGQGGTYQGSGTVCSPNPCPPPAGACCFPNGTCLSLTQSNCSAQGGAYQGDGASCSPNPCPQPTGACCLGGSCQVLTQTECTSQGGTYQGNGIACSPNPCTGSQQVTFTSVLDNTLYQDAAGALSNGKGQVFFAGTTNAPLIRRGLVAFDTTSIPTNAVISNAQLKLYMSYTQANAAHDVTVHNALGSWGEGTSDASGNETGGAASTVNDATWIHRFYSSILWTTPGGDFNATPSATTNVGTALGFYTWSSPGLIADVQTWVAIPSANRGWLLRCDEVATRTHRGFDTREGADSTRRPMLIVTYTIPQITGACCFPDGTCQVLTFANCGNQGGLYQGNGTLCTPNPCPQPTGACCFPDGTCQTLTALNCTSQNGIYQGNGSTCSPNTCPQPMGACCFPDGSCQVLTASDCTAQGGLYQGNATSCAPNPCPQPTGACCFANGTCAVLTQSTCGMQGGSYQGNFAPCTPNPCPQPTGACCLNSGYCVVVSADSCAMQLGTYQGDNSACATDLCPIILTPYLDALPIPPLATPTTGTPGGAATYDMDIVQFQQALHQQLPPTIVWGFEGMYPGPTILATRDIPITVNWHNDLRDEMGNLRTTHYLPVELCIHGAENAAKVVTHLHGGHVPMASDGYPYDWIMPGQSASYFYPNHQLPSLIWYHDHALGVTRLNVYMGLAGGYVITDAFEQSLALPSGPYDVPLVIQDRNFYPNGSLRYPAVHQEHFFGDKMLVNGKVWPYFNVKQGKYRLRALNGCNSRTLRLAFSNGLAFHQIGTDGGLLQAPVAMTDVLLGAGERADLIVDFSSLPAGTEIVLLNSAAAPYPNGNAMHELTNVMKFIVTSQVGHTAPLPATLHPLDAFNPNDAHVTRDFVLRKMPDACTGSMWMINDLPYDTITEYPLLGTIETWNFINRSGVSHPMHLHLVMFQVLNRQDFDVVNDQIVPVGDPIPPEQNEIGWKDTVMVHPNQMTRVIMKFENYTGKYSYHCHILEHEEHEMMRQFQSICRKGDTNQDTRVNGMDIQLFVDAVVNGSMAGTAQFCATDMDNNGAINSDLDVPLFVDCLLDDVCP